MAHTLAIRRGAQWLFPLPKGEGQGEGKVSLGEGTEVGISAKL